MAVTIHSRPRSRRAHNNSHRERYLFLFLVICMVAVLQLNSRKFRSAQTRVKYVAKVPNSNILTIPKQIWMLWDRGFEHPSAKKEAATSLLSWQLINPGWEIKALNISEAEALTNRQQYINDTVWEPINMAGKGDIYRILLLHKYGGVWADASLMCSVPLDSWLTLQQHDLYTFMRFDNLQEQKSKSLNPWFTSWFLASPPKSYTVTKLRDNIVDPNNAWLFTSEYFWLHRSFAKLVANDEKARRNANRFPSSDAAICQTRGWWETAPVFKRCANDIFKDYLIPNHLKCCQNGISIYTANTTTAGMTPEECKTWDCTTLGPNYVLPLAKDHHDRLFRNINQNQGNFK